VADYMEEIAHLELQAGLYSGTVDPDDQRMDEDGNSLNHSAETLLAKAREEHGMARQTCEYVETQLA
jgi:hypothetical protein